MKIPADQKENIISGMLDILHPEATEIREEIKNVRGRDLINLHGVYKDLNGVPIHPGTMYVFTQPYVAKVNHRQRMAQIIADAPDTETMLQHLAEHLVKFAKDKAAVIASIPAHLSISNIKRHEN